MPRAPVGLARIALPSEHVELVFGRLERLQHFGSSSGSSTSKKSVGDACTCENFGGDEDAYKVCKGNTTACFDLDLSCLAEDATGKGTCVVTCSKDDLGAKCPTGGTCRSSGKKALTGEYWMICD